MSNMDGPYGPYGPDARDKVAALPDVSVHLAGTWLTVSREVADEMENFNAAVTSLFNCSPEEMAERRRIAAQQRAEERQAAVRNPLTMDRLLDALGFTQEYAEHLVQSYCTCGDSYDGWSKCSHAYDEGLT